MMGYCIRDPVLEAALLKNAPGTRRGAIGLFTPHDVIVGLANSLKWYPPCDYETSFAFLKLLTSVIGNENSKISCSLMHMVDVRRTR